MHYSPLAVPAGSTESPSTRHGRNLKSLLVGAAIGLIAAPHFTQAESFHVGGPMLPGHARPPLHFNATPANSVYYSPAQIRHAYGVDKLAASGKGQKIAIIDAYGSSSMQRDLNTFCSYFGLPPITVPVYYPQGKTGVNTGW